MKFCFYLKAIHEWKPMLSLLEQTIVGLKRVHGFLGQSFVASQSIGVEDVVSCPLLHEVIHEVMESVLVAVMQHTLAVELQTNVPTPVNDNPMTERELAQQCLRFAC